MANPDSDTDLLYNRLDLKALHPLDLVKFLLEQYIFADYLKLTGSDETAEEYKKLLDSRCNDLPRRLSGPTTVKSDLYQWGLEQLESISHERYHEIRPSELVAIFNQPVEGHYRFREYSSSITETFLTQWLSLTVGHWDKELYPDGKMYNAPLYILRSQVELNYDPNVAKENNTDYLSTVALVPVPATSFSVDTDRIDYSLSEFINRFTFKDFYVDDLIGVLSGFSLDHSRYDMTSLKGQVNVRISDVCYDLVTGSTFVPSCAGLAQSQEVSDFLNVIQLMCHTGRLRGIDESELFGRLLQICGEKPELVNYFIKPVNQITSTEAMSFRKSEYSSIMQDRVIAAMEAADEPDTQDTVSDTDEDAAPTDEEAETTSGEDDVQSGADAIDQASEEAEKVDHQPEIDPNLMLLELASPKETMSDYLYRETVNRRISNILKNPPENARSNDLLLLKRFKSRWLYLVSISTIRDFLTRISTRLSGH